MIAFHKTSFPRNLGTENLLQFLGTAASHESRDDGSRDTFIFFVMEKFSKTLDQIIYDVAYPSPSKSELKDPKEALRTTMKYSIEIIQGLRAIHRRGRPHRDLRPVNIMVSTSHQ